MSACIFMIHDSQYEHIDLITNLPETVGLYSKNGNAFIMGTDADYIKSCLCLANVDTAIACVFKDYYISYLIDIWDIGKFVEPISYDYYYEDDNDDSLAYDAMRHSPERILECREVIIKFFEQLESFDPIKFAVCFGERLHSREAGIHENYVCAYLKNVNERIPELEERIPANHAVGHMVLFGITRESDVSFFDKYKHNPTFLADYAIMVEKSRVPEFEPTILTNPHATFRYVEMLGYLPDVRTFATAMCKDATCIIRYVESRIDNADVVDEIFIESCTEPMDAVEYMCSSGRILSDLVDLVSADVYACKMFLGEFPGFEFLERVLLGYGEPYAIAHYLSNNQDYRTYNPLEVIVCPEAIIRTLMTCRHYHMYVTPMVERTIMRSDRNIVEEYIKFHMPYPSSVVEESLYLYPELEVVYSETCERFENDEGYVNGERFR